MSLTELISPDGQFLGITWSVWKVVGWVGNAIFFSRFIVQWHATEKRKQVVIPAGFWWLSLMGSLILLIYGLHRRDSVFIFAYLFTWIPYTRNLIIHYRHKEAHVACTCGVKSPPSASFCSACGNNLSASAAEKTTPSPSIR